MKIKFKDIESILISKISAATFAVMGVGLGAVAYFKFKVPPPEVTQTVIQDNRNPLDVARDQKLSRAAALVKKGMYKSAEEILLEIYTESSKNAYFLSLLSFSEKKAGRLENAERHLAAAIDLEPGQWVLHHNMGMLQFNKGRSQEAMKHFEKALELSPKNYRVLLSMGRLQEQQGKFTDARLAYGKSLEGKQMDPSTVNVVKDRIKKLNVLAYIERGDK
ncbi:MAG: tetratricopeptide repeat protein [Bdellovibrionota bacterium]